jgi:hypothetical protein
MQLFENQIFLQFIGWVCDLRNRLQVESVFEFEDVNEVRNAMLFYSGKPLFYF